MRTPLQLMLRVALACAPALLYAQGDSARAGGGGITGSVYVAGTTVPLANAVVEIVSENYARLTDAQGQFVVLHLAAGSYHVRVRRIGYSPRDVEVVVVAGETATPRIALTRIAVQLERVTVSSRAACTEPGLPAAGAEGEQSAVATVLQQVSQNAAQYKLVTDAYPYAYLSERTSRNLYSDSATEVVRVDTLRGSSTSKWRYRPGFVVVSASGQPGEASLVVPTFRDFAEPAFQQSHCFDYGGVETVDGRPAVRVDFRVADAIKTPDVDGTIYLDTATFQVLSVVANLTHADALKARGLEKYTAVTTTYKFVEIAPAIRVLDFMVGKGSVRPGSVRHGVVAELQDQHIIAFQFLKDVPSGAPR